MRECQPHVRGATFQKQGRSGTGRRSVDSRRLYGQQPAAPIRFGLPTACSRRCPHCSSQVVESLAADVSHFAAELARADTGADRSAPQALHVSAVMIHKDFEYTLVKPSDLTHLTKEINVCSILQQQTVKTHSWFSRASCCVRVRARCAAACACARRCASCARVRCAHGWTVAV